MVFSSRDKIKPSSSERAAASAGEECDPPNLEGAGCTAECKRVVCPALSFDVDGGSVAVRSGAS